ncbi:M23 family metallopeptidase [Patescibacteria group bacterium]|nr:M23 family metallopeptidase [Patescibacteria group bacterium]
MDIIASDECSPGEICAVMCDTSGPTPPPEPITTFPPPEPGVITPALPYVVTYSQTFRNSAGFSYDDSLIVDTFSVTADSATGARTTAVGAASVIIGDPPTNCPMGWPIARGAYVTQGAYTSGLCGDPPFPCSHIGLEATDWGASGSTVFATHSGIARVSFDSCIGRNIDIISTCEGRSFLSRYAHLESTYVTTGEDVVLGQSIGLSGNTGSCTSGPHLHYRFRYLPIGNPGSSGTDFLNYPPCMWTPYLPANIPRGCKTVPSCGTTSQ